MEKYHLRRTDKEIVEETDILEIIDRQEFLTIALCKDNQPYLVSLNYGFDKNAKCFYFHCAKEGRKISYMKSNPKVYGQIIEDLKYKAGECSYAYRSVQFDGIVEFVDGHLEKRHALSLMIEKLERPDQIESMKTKFITDSSVDKVTIGKISNLQFSGKEERL